MRTLSASEIRLSFSPSFDECDFTKTEQKKTIDHSDCERMDERRNLNGWPKSERRAFEGVNIYYHLAIDHVNCQCENDL